MNKSLPNKMSYLVAVKNIRNAARYIHGICSGYIAGKLSSGSYPRSVKSGENQHQYISYTQCFFLLHIPQQREASNVSDIEHIIFDQ